MDQKVELTHTRISKEYLEKLKKLAAKNKRLPRAQLEYLIDKELTSAKKI